MEKSGGGCTHNTARAYREGGEGHAHATEAIESQGNKDKDGEICKQHRCYLMRVPTVRQARAKSSVLVPSPFGW